MQIGAILPVGTIIHSMLTTTQFASEYGDNWVLADGRSCSGTKYASITGFSVIPDMQGAFLRAKGSTWNPDGNLALGTQTSAKTRTTLPDSYTGSGTSYYISGFSNGGGTLTNKIVGDNETSPVSITVNVFIRIN